MPRAIDAAIMSSVICLVRGNGHLRLALGPAPAHPWFRDRWKAAHRRFRAGLRRLAAIPAGEAFIVPEPLSLGTMADLSRLDRQLHEILYPRLSARTVVEILGITAAERRAWSDGSRLPLVQYAIGRRGSRSWRFPSYDGRAIAALAERPDLIEEWRGRAAEGAAS